MGIGKPFFPMINQNPLLSASYYELAAADAERQSARAALFPKLNLSETYMRTNNPVSAFGTLLNQGNFTAADFALDQLHSPDGSGIPQYHARQPWSEDQTAIKWDGEWHITYETFRDMGIAFGAALLLIYLLIVWEFQSFLVPLLIMVPIPLTLIGIIPGHWMTGSYFTATSMIGFIALSGIIVRNSILLVDFIRSERATGASLHDAVIRAGAIRTRPIMLTAAALMAGAFVIILDPIFQGLAISLLFGVFASTLLTLIVIPLLYYTFAPPQAITPDRPLSPV